MPKAKRVLNAFTANEVTSITNLSRPMVDYLATHAFLRPAYVDEANGNRRRTSRRGRVRYYSFRDLVIARIVQRLREGGVQLGRLKRAIQHLNANPEWTDSRENSCAKIRWLVSDGKEVLMRHQDGFLEEVTSGQRAFAFIVNLEEVEREVLKKVPARRRPHCSLINTQLLLDTQAA